MPRSSLLLQPQIGFERQTNKNSIHTLDLSFNSFSHNDELIHVNLDRKQDGIRIVVKCSVTVWSEEGYKLVEYILTYTMKDLPVLERLKVQEYTRLS